MKDKDLFDAIIMVFVITAAAGAFVLMADQVIRTAVSLVLSIGS
jgi:preprotein translocase SecE subunit